MRSASWWMVCAAAVCGAGWMSGREAAAQSLGFTAPSVAPSPAVQAMASSSMFGSPPSGAMARPDPTASLSPATTQANIFNNPLAAPLLYSTMVNPSGSILGASTAPAQSSTGAGSGTSTGTGAAAATGADPSSAMPGPGTTQLATMMVLANQQNGLFGTGRMGGTSLARRPQPRAGVATDPASPTRGANRPGGRAARYFNRTAVRPATPRAYFNRRPTSFP